MYYILIYGTIDYDFRSKEQKMHWRYWRSWRYRQYRQYRHAKIRMRFLRLLRLLRQFAIAEKQPYILIYKSKTGRISRVSTVSCHFFIDTKQETRGEVSC